MQKLETCFSIPVSSVIRKYVKCSRGRKVNFVHSTSNIEPILRQVGRWCSTALLLYGFSTGKRGQERWQKPSWPSRTLCLRYMPSSQQVVLRNWGQMSTADCCLLLRLGASFIAKGCPTRMPVSSGSSLGGMGQGCHTMGLPMCLAKMVNIDREGIRFDPISC